MVNDLAATVYGLAGAPTVSPDEPEADAEVLDEIYAVLRSGRPPTAKLLRLAALVTTGTSELPKGADLVRLATLIGVSSSSAYAAIRAEAEGEPAPAAATALYRYFDADDLLLYVGISVRAPDRADDHNHASAWMKFAVRSTIDTLPDRSLALEAERVAIRHERPLFNIQGNDTPAARERRAEYLARRSGTFPVSHAV